MPDVFHVISDMGVGGAGVFLSHLLSDPENAAGSLVLLPKGSLLCSRLQALGIPHEILPLSGEHSFRASDLEKYRLFFKKKRPALVVSHASLSARAAAKSLGIPALSVRHCDTRISHGLVWLYNAVTDATVATSLPLSRHLQGAGIRHVVTIENGHTPMGVPSEEERLAAKKKLSLPTDRILIGLSGRLAPVKGHETAIEAFSLLGNNRRRFALCFLGSGEEEGRLRALVRRLGLTGEIRFLGFLSDPRLFYHAMDAHISCSCDSETSSLSLAEGLSAGCVTFASDIAGNRARVGDGGLLFPVGDASALAALFLLLLEKGKTLSLRARALSRARTLPLWQDTRRAYAALFDTFC